MDIFAEIIDFVPDFKNNSQKKPKQSQNNYPNSKDNVEETDDERGSGRPEAFKDGNEKLEQN